MKTLLLLLLLQSCTHLFYQPSKQSFYAPQQFRLKHQDVWFQAQDGNKLHGWFLPAETEKVIGTIVHFHGNAENITTHFLNLAWIVKAGFNLFIFDYRGYGLSEGTPSQAGLHKDALAALRKGRELQMANGKGRFIVYGQSLGGAVALRALADYPEIGEVDLIVMDSTFGSYKEVAWEKLTSRWFLYPLSPLALIAVSDAYAPKHIYPQIHRPSLVIVGQHDYIIPSLHGKKLYSSLPSKQKWLWKLPQGRHIDVFHGSNESYRKSFLELVNSLQNHR